MSGTAARDLVVLPPVRDDPIFSDLSSDQPAVDDSRPIGADPHDFAGLFIRHKWSFQLHARRFLSDRRDIDEVVQEGFLKLFLAMPELETELQALAYARRTITNLCIDRYRADQRRPRLIDLESLPAEAWIEEDESDPLIQAEDAATVREALAMLSPLHRAALIKREIEEKPLPQIAAELDIPVEQVKHVLHRARRSLRRLLVGTHVEPGLDLDLSLVLHATRMRAVSAAKPTGAALIAVLLMLAGFVGLRSGGGRAPRVLDVAGAGSARGLSGGPVRPSLPAHAVASAPSATTVTALSGAAPGKAPVRGKSASPRGASSRAFAPRTSAPAPALPTVIPSLVATPSAEAAHAVGAPTRPKAFVVIGIGGSGVGSVTDQQRDLTGAGTTSRSTFMSSNRHGAYSLKQAYLFAPDGSLAGVELGEVVPVAEGAVPTVVMSTSTNVQELTTGAVALTSTGVAAAVGSVNGKTLAPRTLTVAVVLSPDRVSVLSERITTVEPNTADAVTIMTSSDVTLATPTMTPAPDPTPTPTPTTPQPTAGQIPSPLAATEPARPADAAVPVDPGATPYVATNKFSLAGRPAPGSDV